MRWPPCSPCSWEGSPLAARGSAAGASAKNGPSQCMVGSNSAWQRLGRSRSQPWLECAPSMCRISLCLGASRGATRLALRGCCHRPLPSNVSDGRHAAGPCARARAGFRRTWSSCCAPLLSQNSLQTHLNLRALLRQQKRWTEARRHLEFVRRYFPDGDAGTYSLLSDIDTALGDPRAAADAVRFGLRMFPDNSDLKRLRLIH
jgi:hypothetical protein